MTDRVHSLTVALENDMRTDDVESLIQAIRHLRFVANVKGNVSDASHYVAEVRADQDWRRKILALFETHK